MPIHYNPVDDKVRSARKRHGDRAALWALLTSLYASGRDEEADDCRRDLRMRGAEAEDVLLDALALPDIAGGLGEGLVGWVALRYQAAERSGDLGRIEQLEDILPRAAYPITEWTQRARPRPNLFDYSVEEAYAAAKKFLDGKEKAPVRQGPVVFRFDDGWTVQHLNTRALLVDEGNHQNLCVGQDKQGYPQRVMDGQIKVYSLRDADGRPHVTMTWRQPHGIFELAGHNNDAVTDSSILLRCAIFGQSEGMTDVALVRAGLLSPRFAVLAGYDLSDANLANADLQGKDLSNSKLVRANLHLANLAGANIGNADMSYARMHGTNLEGALLNHSMMHRAFLVEANMRGANLKYAILAFANLGGASLVDADLSFTDFTNALLASADFRGARFHGTNLDRAVYTDKTRWPEGFDPTAAGARLVKGVTDADP